MTEGFGFRLFLAPTDIALQHLLTNLDCIVISLYFFGTSGCRAGCRWLEKLGIIPAQPPTEAGVGAELGNNVG